MSRSARQPAIRSPSTPSATIDDVGPTTASTPRSDQSLDRPREPWSRWHLRPPRRSRRWLPPKPPAALIAPTARFTASSSDWPISAPSPDRGTSNPMLQDAVGLAQHLGRLRDDVDLPDRRRRRRVVRVVAGRRDDHDECERGSDHQPLTASAVSRHRAKVGRSLPRWKPRCSSGGRTPSPTPRSAGESCAVAWPPSPMTGCAVCSPTPLGTLPAARAPSPSSPSVGTVGASWRHRATSTSCSSTRAARHVTSTSSPAPCGTRCGTRACGSATPCARSTSSWRSPPATSTDATALLTARWVAGDDGPGRPARHGGTDDVATQRPAVARNLARQRPRPARPGR